MADYGLSKSFSEHSLSVSSAQSSSGSESSGTRNLVASNLISLDSSESDLIVKRKNLKNKEKVESDIHSSLLPNGDVESDEIVDISENPAGGSDFSAGTNMLKSMMGILGIPKAFTKSGLILGTVGFIIISVVCVYTMLSLVHTARLLRLRKLKKVVTYSDVANEVFGRKGEICVHAFVIVMEMIFSIGMLIITAQTLEAAFPELKGKGFFLQLGLIPFCIGLVQITLMKDLWIISFFGVAVYVIGVIGVTFYYGIEVTLNLGYDDWHFAVWSSFGIFLGTSIYALEGINQILPVEASMKRQDHAMWVLGISNSIYCFLLIAYGSFGYVVGFGECDVVINCLPQGVTRTIVAIALVLAILATYPISLYPIFEMMEPLLFPESDAQYLLKRRGFRSTVALVTVAVAALVGPNFSLFSAFAGSLLSSIAGFIFPPLLAIYVDYPSTSNFTYAVNVPIIIVGVASAVFGVYSSGYEIYMRLSS